MGKRTRYVPLTLDLVPAYESICSDRLVSQFCDNEKALPSFVSLNPNSHSAGGLGTNNRAYIPLPYTNTPVQTPNQGTFPFAPTPGKVCYLPPGGTIPETSIVHVQKRQCGFFKHPVLVVSVDSVYAHFYALTRTPPVAIADLSMCLRLGNTYQDEGSEVLALAEGSCRMQNETWVNLEQRFKIEVEHLQPWSVDVTIAPFEKGKLMRKIDWLEAEQNRFIYKPLPRDLSSALPGTVVMLPNPPGSNTLGAPVLILENQYPKMRFLRIKLLYNSPLFREPLDPAHAKARANCLVIEKQLRPGHEGTYVMLLQPWSPEMREKSYIEVCKKPKTGWLSKCQTWCYPSIQIQPWSVKLLLEHIAKMPATYPYACQPMWTPYHPAYPSQSWEDIPPHYHMPPCFPATVGIDECFGCSNNNKKMIEDGVRSSRSNSESSSESQATNSTTAGYMNTMFGQLSISPPTSVECSSDEE